MEIALSVPRNAQVVESYGDAGFRVSGVRFDGPIQIKTHACAPWTSDGSLDLADVSQAQDFLADCEVVLIGTGARSVFLPPSLRQALKDRGLVCDSMDTGAACRTYNVLLGDGRKVGALLLPLSFNAA